MTLGHTTLGAGAGHAIVLHDWLDDTSTWLGARRFLDTREIRWTFADLRGYGRSRGQTGSYTLEEAAADVLALADGLRAERFALVGHSMSTLVALHLAQRQPERVRRVVLITPPPPAGLGADEDTERALQTLARGDVTRRLRAMNRFVGDRLGSPWLRFKAERWHACADPEAAAGYVTMFARRGLPDLSTPLQMPVLALTGECDAESMRCDATTRALSPLCPSLQVRALPQCGHYPMQELPPLTARWVSEFVAGE